MKERRGFNSTAVREGSELNGPLGREGSEGTQGVSSFGGLAAA